MIEEELGYLTQDLEPKVVKTLKRQDSYGFQKLESEYVLQKYLKEKALILRLPDVIGPFDDSSRFWKYLFWVQNQEKYELELDKLA